MFKKHKLLLTLLFSVLSGHIILAQNYFVSNTYNNLVFSNPTYPHFFDHTIAQLNYRNQWPVSNMYTSYGLSYFHNADKLNCNFGAILNYDNEYNGTFSNLSAGLNYSYKFQASRRSHLIFGLQGLYSQASINYSQLQFEDATAVVMPNEKSIYPTINVGMAYLLQDQHYFGASLINLLSDKDFPNNNLTYTVSYIGHVKMKNYYSSVYFEPMLYFSTDLAYIQLQYGANLSYDGLKVGFSLNQTEINISTMVFLLGISFENYEFVYTYDLNLSGAVTINPKMAAHEVTFLKKLQYKGRSKRRGAIKCPDI